MGQGQTGKVQLQEHSLWMALKRRQGWALVEAGWDTGRVLCNWHMCQGFLSVQMLRLRLFVDHYKCKGCVPRKGDGARGRHQRKAPPS